MSPSLFLVSSQEEGISVRCYFPAFSKDRSLGSGAVWFLATSINFLIPFFNLLHSVACVVFAGLWLRDHRDT